MRYRGGHRRRRPATVFDEFTQTNGAAARNQGGAGLGLAVCKHFVQLHGGRITVESQLGKGTTFRFTLPVPESGRARSRLHYYVPEGWSPPLPADRLGQSVLVLAEDEATAQVVARGIVGFRTVPLAVDEVNPALIQAEHPSAIVLVRDPLAPGDRPGAEALWRAAGRTDLPVIECEVPSDDSARERLGVDAYMTKPVESDELAEVISPLLHSGSEATGADRPHFLIVDDAAGFRTLMRRELLRLYPAATVHDCGSAEDGLARLRQGGYDLLMLDLVMPGGGGLELLREARGEGLLDATRIVVTSGAAYIDDLADVYPTHLRYSKGTPPRSREWFGCIAALAAAAPPDYARPVPTEG
jgi:CheY-like chemotaxis protein